MKRNDTKSTKRLIQVFERIRDTPYRIPLRYGAKDDCCMGKHERLLGALRKMNVPTRYRICLFQWSSLGLPSKLLAVPHNDYCTHTYLEVKHVEVKRRRWWMVLDATWDVGISKRFKVNTWNGTSPTSIAVKPIKIFSPKRSLAIVRAQTRNAIVEDLKINGAFYKAMNGWLTLLRRKNK